MNTKKKVSINFIAAMVVILLGFILAVGYPGKEAMLEKVNAKKSQGKVIEQQKYVPKTSTVKKEKKKIIVATPTDAGASDDEGC
ncbi:hypothetical protein MNBD_IGNAVI01-1322 [hydrothermal vent metagenome]|uniref:Uncharacterized protein n=1 Tax=hydrothermal vent metagenome TaxID=652676 RepID=A0A3B1CEM3_9ZZZZ